jgi:AmmeMemoRadiSam system protein B
LVAPHIDFQRGGATYAWAYKPLAEAREAPELIVIFGTDHMPSDVPFTLTKKHYDTPLGRFDTDGDLVDALTAGVAERLGPHNDARQRLFLDEHHHLGEHSIEFQMVWLRYALKERADGIRVLPILCGSLPELVDGTVDPATDPRLQAVFETLRQIVACRRTLFVASADLAHVGPRFGDTDPLDGDDRSSIERCDQQTLAAAATGDGARWFDEIRREKNRRRVCGLPPIYAMLQVAQPGTGKLYAYDQCPADERGGSLVSIASLVYSS